MIEQLFFELIQVAIGTRICLSHTPNADEWGELYVMAKKQSLVGVCFAGVQKLKTQEQCPPEMLYLTWMGMAAKIQQRNETVNKQCIELQDRFTKEGFRSCILKGQGNLANYGDLCMLRQSGDIDIWVDSGFEKVNSFIQAIHPTKKINVQHIEFACFADTEVEVHYYPFTLNNPLQNRVLDQFFKKHKEEQFANQLQLPSSKLNIVAATNEFNSVFHLAHIFQHLFTEGIGLRQLMDYHFVVKHEMEVQNGSNVMKVREVVDLLGLNKFASALMWVLGEVFGLERDYMTWAPNEKDGRFLLKEIMMSGNFGHHDERIPKNMSYWKSFWYLNFHNLRLIRFDYWSWFWTPIMRINGFVWRKMHGYE